MRPLGSRRRRGGLRGGNVRRHRGHATPIRWLVAHVELRSTVGPFTTFTGPRIRLARTPIVVVTTLAVTGLRVTGLRVTGLLTGLLTGLRVTTLPVTWAVAGRQVRRQFRRQFLDIDHDPAAVLFTLVLEADQRAGVVVGCELGRP